MRRERIVIRLHVKLRAILENEAKKAGLTTSSFANLVLNEEIENACEIGIDQYELSAALEEYLPKKGSHEKTSSPQISFYMPKENMDVLKQLQSRFGYVSIRNGQLLPSYKEIIAGMLLNYPTILRTETEDATK